MRINTGPLRLLPILLAAACGIAGAASMVTTAFTGNPGLTITVTLIAAACTILQADITAAKLIDTQYRRTHRLPTGNAATAVLSASVLVAVTNSDTNVAIATAAVAALATIILAHWFANCVRISIDETMPTPDQDASLPLPDAPSALTDPTT